MVLKMQIRHGLGLRVVTCPEPRNRTRVKRVGCMMSLTPETAVGIRSGGMCGEHTNPDEPQRVGDDGRHGT